uniref:scavenger receptor class A member 5-like n=1 Tax=Styela clava TaxID=7725 RepID=UPI0019392805|nr:scavenger receptor class A member 5-like [Styela clava]
MKKIEKLTVAEKLLNMSRSELLKEMNTLYLNNTKLAEEMGVLRNETEIMRQSFIRTKSDVSKLFNLQSSTTRTDARQDSSLNTLDRKVSALSVVRLVGSGLSYRGRVEIYHQGIWGTVCNDYFDSKDAKVVCKMLGYVNGGVSSTKYGQGTGKIWLDDLSCTGTEPSLFHCAHNGWGAHNCNHGEDVMMYCY